MPTVGYVLGSFFADLVSKWSHWIAFVLLLFIGGSMIKESFGEEEEVDADMSFKVMFLLAVATSIDALAECHLHSSSCPLCISYLRYYS